MEMADQDLCPLWHNSSIQTDDARSWVCSGEGQTIVPWNGSPFHRNKATVIRCPQSQGIILKMHKFDGLLGHRHHRD
jgi:hypothetical protein